MRNKYLELHLVKIKSIVEAFQQTGKGDVLFFYKADLRTPLFMLEGICRLYRKIYDAVTFDTLLTNSKKVEDALGAIDYYDQLLKDLSTDKKITKQVLQFIETEKKSKTEVLHELMLKDNWFDKNIIEGFTEADTTTHWLSQEKECEQIKKTYQKECDKVASFIREKLNHFDDMEQDVHELRRKLRWLSIYVHALKGLFELKAPKSIKEKYQKYLTPEVLQSRFNQVEKDDTLAQTITLKKNCFLALSCAIARIGKVKDEGLVIEGLSVALAHIHQINDREAVERASMLLGYAPDHLDQLKQTTNQFVGTFYNDEILTKLVD